MRAKARARARARERERERESDNQTVRQSDSQTETDRQTDRQRDRQTDRQTEKCVCVCMCVRERERAATNTHSTHLGVIDIQHPKASLSRRPATRKRRTKAIGVRHRLVHALALSRICCPQGRWTLGYEPAPTRRPAVPQALLSIQARTHTRARAISANQQLRCNSGAILKRCRHCRPRKTSGRGR